MITIKFLKFSNIQDVCCNHPKIHTKKIFSQHGICPKGAEGIARSSLIRVCTVCQGLALGKLRINVILCGMFCFVEFQLKIIIHLCFRTQTMVSRVVRVWVVLWVKVSIKEDEVATINNSKVHTWYVTGISFWTPKT